MAAKDVRRLSRELLALSALSLLPSPAEAARRPGLLRGAAIALGQHLGLKRRAPAPPAAPAVPLADRSIPVPLGHPSIAKAISTLRAAHRGLAQLDTRAGAGVASAAAAHPLKFEQAEALYAGKSLLGFRVKMISESGLGATSTEVELRPDGELSQPLFTGDSGVFSGSRMPFRQVLGEAALKDRTSARPLAARGAAEPGPLEVRIHYTRMTPAVRRAQQTLLAANAKIADAIAQKGPVSKDRRYMRFERPNAIYDSQNKLTGYEMEVVTHNGMFPVSGVVPIRPDGSIAKPLFFGDSGLFSNRWNFVPEEVLAEVRRSDLQAKRPLDLTALELAKNK